MGKAGPGRLPQNHGTLEWTLALVVVMWGSGHPGCRHKAIFHKGSQEAPWSARLESWFGGTFVALRKD